MNKQHDVIFEEKTTCLACWSSPEEQFAKNEQKRMMQVNKDKKISLKRQTNIRKTEIYLPIKETHVSANNMNSARGYLSRPIPARGYENIRRTWNYHIRSAQQVLNPINERHTCKSHTKSPQNHEQKQKQQETLYKPDRILLTETTKLQRSIPISQEELLKTRKNQHQQPKKSSSYLYGRQSVSSFTENHDIIQRFQESQIMFDYFNPNEAQLMEIKALLMAQQSRKSSMNNME